MKRKYQICTKTIMDNSDPNIVFNSEGESDYYTKFHLKLSEPNWHTDQRGHKELLQTAEKIKREGVGKRF